MKLISIFIILTAILSCGSESHYQEFNLESDYQIPEKFFDSTLTKYVEEFKADAKERQVDITNLSKAQVIKFKTLGDPIGRCIKWYDHSNDLAYFEIHVDPVAFNYQDPDKLLRGIIYRELGHCVRNLKHREGSYIMNDYVHKAETYQQHWNTMIHSFFEYWREQ